MKRSDVKKLGLAGGIALALILLVVGFVTWQQPEKKDLPPLSAPKLEAMPMAAASITATPEVPAPKAETPPKTVEPKKTPPPKKKAVAKKTPRKRRVVRKTPPKPVRRPVPKARPVAPVAPRGEGFKVKFKSLAVLERLVDSDHVSLVLEYVDGTRFMLPRELDGELVALHIPEGNFQKWVQERRVSELEPTRDLMERFKIHRGDVRYLAVLSGDLRDIIAQEADRAQVSMDRSVMIIDEAQDRPLVSVLLPRK